MLFSERNSRNSVNSKETKVAFTKVKFQKVDWLSFYITSFMDYAHFFLPSNCNYWHNNYNVDDMWAIQVGINFIKQRIWTWWTIAEDHPYFIFLAQTWDIITVSSLSNKKIFKISITVQAKNKIVLKRKLSFIIINIY